MGLLMHIKITGVERLDALHVKINLEYKSCNYWDDVDLYEYMIAFFNQS